MVSAGKKDATSTLVAATMSYDEATRTLILDPVSDLSSNTTDTATVATAAEDPAGNPLTVKKVWRFTTAKK